MSSSNHPADLLASQGLRISSSKGEVKPRRRGVTDLITFTMCARHAHQFSQGRYPSNTPAAVLGQVLHRTIKHLHGHYLAAQRHGQTDWLPAEDDIKDECQMVEESARIQGLPALSSRQSERLQQMLVAFHALEAKTFYPRIRDAELALNWLWEDAPGGPVLLEGKVDVVLLEQGKAAGGIALWDYKTGKRPEPGPQLWNYRHQMRVYALLYHRCFGVLPQELTLYFLGELAGKHRPTTPPPSAILTLTPSEEDEAETLGWLRRVLEQEEACQESDQWDPPEPGEVPKAMCQTCQIRWSCPSVRKRFPWQAGADPENLAEEGYEW